MLLEAFGHPKAAFVTLTYKEEPENGSLDKTDLQNFFKRLRFALEPYRIRYFAVGEYGEKTLRPHYHAIIYGLGREDTETIEKAWGLGFVFVGDFTLESATYCAGYTVKKLTKLDDHTKAILGDQRIPEFALMSRNPGLGVNALPSMVDNLTTDRGHALLRGLVDAPQTLRHAGKILPLGRFVTGKLRQALGISEDGTAALEKADLYKQKMQELRDHLGHLAFASGSVVDWDRVQKTRHLETQSRKRRIL